MVSVGQQLSLMCIGQDVRGNIKLSLKVTLPQPDVVSEAPVSVIKEAPKDWTSVGSMLSGHEEQEPVEDEMHVSRSTGNPSNSSAPAFLIRSAAECDEEEKCVSLSLASKGTSKTVRATKRDHKEKQTRPQSDESDSSVSSFDLSSLTLDNLNDKGAKAEAPISAKGLKLGTKMSAKVYQVRAHGLVLDLGNGIRGMYRFEVCMILLLMILN